MQHALLCDGLAARREVVCMPVAVEEEFAWPHAPGLAPVEPLRLVAKT